MGLDATARRRWLGALMLLAAILMLAAGETILKARLHDFAFLIYWSICFFCTGMAIFMAYLDARVLQQRSRRQARELLESTLKQIERDARATPPHKNGQQRR